ncbi:DUF3037 domain-containing protein [Roseateles depolymerans]|uniref:Uncharacterized protein n=1 Tax=Roseateles depolymerans TaxID=76731 RepID=A0A0U3CFD9_9BURK|nr:DUF3037 domain-containing protein [Roseateles depolymerans]ALV07416.1 hypothetical protein RD2015_2954 [Roseateles depolymerans]REG22370.1 DUF3037 family protein [Roseateles depolymerans]
MKKVACRYAVVQFTPFSETGEFANVGVVLTCPHTKYFGFQLQTRRYKRITSFFDELPKDVYLRAMQVIKIELQRVADVIAAAPAAGQAEYVRHVFDSLIHPREAIIRFSAAKVVLTDDPGLELAKQFDHYVDRSFASPEYVEQAIERRIRTLLGSLELPHPFRPARVGNDDVYVKFPLVQQHGERTSKVIKPFNLDQKEPMGIYDHGGTWLQRVKLLRRHRLLPQDVLFAVSRPPEADAKRYAAFAEIQRELQAEDVQLVDERDEDRIAAFALA